MTAEQLESLDVLDYLNREISDFERNILEISLKRDLIEEQIALFSAEIELGIAEDPSLRNAEMRKAQKTITQATSTKYQEMLGKKRELDLQIADLAIAVENKQRAYSNAKLRVNLIIAIGTEA